MRIMYDIVHLAATLPVVAKSCNYKFRVNFRF